MSEFWIDTRTGDLIVGQPALEQRLPETMPGDIVSLPEILTDESIDLETEYYERFYDRVASREEALELGHWALKLLSAGRQETPKLTRTHLQRLSSLGIVHGYGGIRKHFGTIWQFREELGADQAKTIGKYSDWEIDDYVEYARKVHHSLDGRKPTVKTYNDYAREHGGPSSFLICQKVGSIGELNEHLGYPDFNNFSADDYVDWGLRIMKVNDGKLPTISMIAALSKQGVSPSDATLRSIFGSISNFQESILERQQIENDKVDALAGIYDRIALESGQPTWRENYDCEQKCLFVSKYLVASGTMPDAKHETLGAIAELKSSEFTDTLLTIAADKTFDDIAVIASKLEVEDYIWPPEPPVWEENLYVDEEELRRVRADFASTRRKQYHRKKGA